MSTPQPPADPHGSADTPGSANPDGPADYWQQGPDPATDRHQGAGGLAVTALVLGIVAFLLGLVPFLGLLVGAAAVVLGVVAMRRSTRGLGNGWTFGLVGLVGGGLAVLASLVTSVLLVIALVGASGTATGTAAPAPSPSRSTAPSTPSPSTTAPSPSSPSTPPGPEPVTGGPGEVVAAANGMSYTVTNLTCGVLTLGAPSVALTPEGQFCIVDVSATNGTKAPVRFLSTGGTAYAGDVEYASRIDASIFADPSVESGPINPGQTRDLKITFDVPQDVVLDRITLGLVYEDGADDPGVSIRLS